jgi:alpha-galactosidase
MLRSGELILTVRDGLLLELSTAKGERVGEVKMPLLRFAGGDSASRFRLVPGSPRLEQAAARSRLTCDATALRKGETVRFVLALETRRDLPDAIVASCTVRVSPGTILRAAVQAELTSTAPDGSAPRFWSFQGSSTPERSDWILPLHAGFTRANFLGMNAPDYGGGIPYVDVWNRRWGVGLGSLSPVPEPLAFPVMTTDGKTAVVKLEDRLVSDRRRDDTLYVLIPFVILYHRGDYYNGLTLYSRLMRDRGVSMSPPPPAAFGAEWCAWGYERTFLPDQVTATLAAARATGCTWATLDDGWQSADGDWEPDPRKFPAGLRPMVDAVHAAGLLARLWWVPLEAHDSSYSATHFPERMAEFGMGLQSRLALVHPEWFQLNADGSRTQVSWWNSYTLCPAVPAVRAYYAGLARRMLTDWNADGFKIDGQNMNAVPPCYNALHRHASPYDAPRAVPQFFREIADAARAARADAVLQLCPCGEVFSLYNLPAASITVASDPLSSFQVRHRGKTFRALGGGRAAFSGDHVELTNHVWDESTRRSVVRGTEDFASTIAVGGIPSTKFTITGIPQPDSSLALTAARQRVWQEWIGAYDRERPSEGEYRNLYDIAFDRPETHVMSRGDTLYYGFFPGRGETGAVELRGLGRRTYDLAVFPSGEHLATVRGPRARYTLRSPEPLIIKAVPRAEKATP